MNRTKIIATIGPSTDNFDAIRSMHAAGMNVVRINMSHANHSYAKNIIYLVKSCLLYTSPSPRDVEESRMPSSA